MLFEKPDVTFGAVDMQGEAWDRVYNWLQQLLPQKTPRARTNPHPTAAASSPASKRATHVSSQLATHSTDEARLSVPEEGGKEESGIDLLAVFKALVTVDGLDAAYLVLHRVPSQPLHTIAPLLREQLAG